MSIGYIIRNVRKHKKIEWKDTDLKASRTLLYRIEKGIEEPSEKFKMRIFECLDIDEKKVNLLNDEILEVFLKFKESIFFDNKINFDIYCKINKNDKNYLLCDNYYLIDLMNFMCSIFAKNTERKRIERKYQEFVDYVNFKYIYIAHIYLARYLTIHKEYNEAIYYFNLALNYNMDVLDKSILYQYLGNCYTFQHKYLLALKYMESAKDIAIEYHAFRRLFGCDVQISNILMNLGYLNFVVERNEKLMDNTLFQESYSMFVLWVNTSYIHFKLKQYDKAYLLLQKAERFNSESPELLIAYIFYSIKTNSKDGVRYWVDRASKVLNHRSLNYRIVVMLENYYKNPRLKTTLEIALEVYENISHIEDSFTTLFYLDIVLELLERQHDDKNLIHYIKIKNELLEYKN